MSEASFVVDINEQNFNEVLQQSMQVPVLLDFWADWCEPCKTMTPILESLAEAYQGQFILAKVNADEQKAISQQLAVRSLPTMKLVVKGQLAGELVGAQTETAVRELLDQAIPGGAPVSPGETVETQYQLAKANADIDGGVAAIMAALESEPENNQYKAWMADLLIDGDRIDDAKSVLGQMAADVKERIGPAARLQFLDAASELPSEEELLAVLAKEDKNVEAFFQLGVRYSSQGRFDDALSSFMTVMQLDSGYDDQAARKSLVNLFEVLGAGDERVKKYRRQMFTLMH
ncbi:MAG: tetratricopeptide repeat protein [Pseudomonadales bacterium]|nr:tetratricopeptide repeat protein [Pseudomonadales bacterium]